MLNKINKLATELDSFIKDTETNGIEYFTVTKEILDAAKRSIYDIVTYDIVNMFIVKGVKSEVSKIVEIMDKSLNKDRYVLLNILTTYEQIFELQTESNKIIEELTKSFD